MRASGVVNGSGPDDARRFGRWSALTVISGETESPARRGGSRREEARGGAGGTTAGTGEGVGASGGAARKGRVWGGEDEQHLMTPSARRQLSSPAASSLFGGYRRRGDWLSSGDPSTLEDVRTGASSRARSRSRPPRCGIVELPLRAATATGGHHARSAPRSASPRPFRSSVPFPFPFRCRVRPRLRVRAPPRLPPPSRSLFMATNLCPGSKHEPRGSRLLRAFGDPSARRDPPGVTPLVSGLPYFYVRAPSATSATTSTASRPAALPCRIGLRRAPWPHRSRRLYPGAYPAKFGRFAGGIVSVRPRSCGRVAWRGQPPHFDVGALVEGRSTTAAAASLSRALLVHRGLFSMSGQPQARLLDYQAASTYQSSPRDTIGSSLRIARLPRQKRTVDGRTASPQQPDGSRIYAKYPDGSTSTTPSSTSASPRRSRYQTASMRQHAAQSVTFGYDETEPRQQLRPRLPDRLRTILVAARRARSCGRPRGQLDINLRLGRAERRLDRLFRNKLDIVAASTRRCFQVTPPRGHAWRARRCLWREPSGHPEDSATAPRSTHAQREAHAHPNSA